MDGTTAAAGEDRSDRERIDPLPAGEPRWQDMALTDRDENGAPHGATAPGERFDREALTDTVILPAQIESRPRALPPGVAALMVAVLEEAIGCLFRKGAEGTAGRAEALRAERWIRSNDTSFPFAFESICHALAIDAASLRDAILRETARPDTPLRARRRHEVPRRDRRLETLSGSQTGGRSAKLDVG